MINTFVFSNNIEYSLNRPNNMKKMLSPIEATETE